MKYIAAYMLAIAAGKTLPTKEEVTAIIKAANGEVDDAKLESLFKEVEGKDINELIAAGKEKMSAVPTAPVAAAAAPAAADEKKEEAKEEKKEEEEEEEEGDFGLDLFG